MTNQSPTPIRRTHANVPDYPNTDYWQERYPHEDNAPRGIMWGMLFMAGVLSVVCLVGWMLLK